MIDLTQHSAPHGTALPSDSDIDAIFTCDDGAKALSSVRPVARETFLRIVALPRSTYAIRLSRSA